MGWWRKAGAETGHQTGRQADRLLITHVPRSGTLSVSGRAYWYGLADNVHFGEIVAAARPAGPHLHLVEGDNFGSCVLDLRLDPSTHTLQALDNAACGGMNVRFSGHWYRFTPTGKSRPLAQGTASSK